MSTEEAKNKIQNLRKELEYHNHRYYVLAQPEISDFEYDIKMKELQKLEAEFPEPRFRRGRSAGLRARGLLHLGGQTPHRENLPPP